MIDALFPRTKQRVLALLFGQADRSFATMELIRLAHAGSGAVQRELDRLVASGLVSVTVTERQKRFAANRESPVFVDLQAIVEKTIGVPGVLKATLATLESSVRFATLYGSAAKGSDSATSDLDLLIVADDLALERLYAVLQPAEAKLGRRVSPTVYTPEEFRRRRKAGHPFVTKVLSGEHVVLLGNEDAIPTR